MPLTLFGTSSVPVALGGLLLQAALWPSLGWWQGAAWGQNEQGFCPDGLKRALWQRGKLERDLSVLALTRTLIWCLPQPRTGQAQSCWQMKQCNPEQSAKLTEALAHDSAPTRRQYSTTGCAKPHFVNNCLSQSQWWGAQTLHTN